MTQAEHDLMITLALVVRGLASPDDQRLIDRKLAALQAEHDTAQAERQSIEARLTALEENSHPPIDLAPAIADILGSSGMVVPAPSVAAPSLTEEEIVEKNDAPTIVKSGVMWAIKREKGVVEIEHEIDEDLRRFRFPTRFAEGEFEGRAISQGLRQQPPDPTALDQRRGVVLWQVAEILAGKDQPRCGLHRVDRRARPLGMKTPDVACAPIAPRHETLALDQFHRHVIRGQPEQGMAGPAVESVAFLVKRNISQSQQDLGEAADRHMYTALVQLAQQLVRRAHFDRDMDISHRACEPRQHRVERCLSIADRVVDEADREAAAHQPPQRAGAQIETIDGAEQLLRLGEDRLAILCQAEPGAAALAEFHPEPGFQRRDLVADRRGADVQRRLRARKPARLDDGGKDPEQPQVDGIETWRYGVPPASRWHPGTRRPSR